MVFKVEMVIFDCSDFVKFVGWWVEQFDGMMCELLFGEFVVVVWIDGLWLGFQKVFDFVFGKNCVYFDFMIKDLDVEVLCLVVVGVSEVGWYQVGESFCWVVLVDFEGNVFCVVG